MMAPGAQLRGTLGADLGALTSTLSQLLNHIRIGVSM